MNKKSKAERKTVSIESKITWIDIIPIVLSLLIIPLTIRLKMIALPEEIYMMWTGKTWNADFFSYYKGVLVILSAVIAVILYFLRFFKNETVFLKPDKKWGVWYYAIGVFVLLILISSLLSPYKYLSILGAPDRYEGSYVWVAYVILLFYATKYQSQEKKDLVVIGTVYLLIFIMGIIGWMQYIGKDLFEMTFIQKFIIPGAYQDQIRNFNVAKEGVRNIYGTSYHYNYMGSLTPMMFAFSVVLVIFHHKVWVKKVGIAAAVVSLFLLIASTARSGIIALIIFALVMGAFFGNRLLLNRRRKKILSICILGLIGLLFLGGKLGLFYRLPSLAEDLKSILYQSSEMESYREQIHLKDVHITDGKIRIETKKHILSYSPKTQKFWDEEGREIEYDQKAENLWQLHAPYEDYEIAFAQSLSKEEQYIKLDDGVVELYFREKNGEVTATNPRGKEISLEEAPSIGFQGRERLGSSRGYIWSRTLPLLKKSWVLGYGADTFLAVFPQGDLYAKLYSYYGEMWTVVDKPHNLYLQMAMNFGVFSVVIFLFLFIKVAKVIFEKYHPLEAKADSKAALAIACFMSAVSYLGAGFFNDSVLSVAPVFWVLLGLSVALLQE